MKDQLILFMLQTLSLLPLALARWLGSIVGGCCWVLKTRGAAATQANINHCYPQLTKKEQQQLAKSSMIEWGKTVLEIPLIWGKTPQWLRSKIVNVENLELFQALLAQDKGLILVAPHLGNWEACGVYCCAEKTLMNMYDPMGKPVLDEWIKNARAKAGTELAPTSQRGVVALLKALKNNQQIGILPDQVPPFESGDYAPFFGHPALTITLLHKLLKRSGANAVFTYAKRVPGGFTIIFNKAPEELFSDDPAVALSALNKGVQNCVNQIPEQYQWEYKRFRRQPEGLPDIYKGDKT